MIRKGGEGRGGSGGNCVNSTTKERIIQKLTKLLRETQMSQKKINEIAWAILKIDKKRRRDSLKDCVDFQEEIEFNESHVLKRRSSHVNYSRWPTLMVRI